MRTISMTPRVWNSSFISESGPDAVVGQVGAHPSPTCPQGQGMRNGEGVVSLGKARPEMWFCKQNEGTDESACLAVGLQGLQEVGEKQVEEGSSGKKSRAFSLGREKERRTLRLTAQCSGERRGRCSWPGLLGVRGGHGFHPRAHLISTVLSPSEHQPRGKGERKGDADPPSKMETPPPPTLKSTQQWTLGTEGLIGSCLHHNKIYKVPMARLISVLDTELCWSPIPEIIHFILFVAFSLMFLIILRPYLTPREPSSGPPREENSKNDRAEVGEWIRIRNRYITSKDYKRLLKQLEKLEEVFLLAK
ncbi:PREDICTED: uncharacterized protein LOC105597456 [Cercocebus atys]|uniref:uncharacterized protein LOC105597456 n=1 Tax=Cercocebus atys TaxID=9531 RepID=UPI0005F4AD54|nr:PREDICTED: uncharacterized protein LOC105597456 [Cercocebus atys]